MWLFIISQSREVCNICSTPSYGRFPPEMRARSLRLLVEHLARDIDPSLTVHDLRTGDAGLSFDVMVPYRFRLTDLEVRRAMERRLEEQLPRCPVQIQIDHSYVRGRDA